MLRLSNKQKKDLKFLTAVMLFLCVAALLFYAFLDGKIRNFYQIKCENHYCQTQTTAWFGLGGVSEWRTFRQPDAVDLRYSDGRLPHYCAEIKGVCLPFEFYFKKPAEDFQNRLVSAQDFEYSSFSLMLLWFLLTYGCGFLLAFAIILGQKKSASKE